jgi:hypothetical protein
MLYSLSNAKYYLMFDSLHNRSAAGARGSVVLRHYAASRKVTASSPEEVDFLK